MSNTAENIIAFGLSCNKCGEVKPIDCFQNDLRRYSIDRHGKKSICKDCRNTASRIKGYQKKNKTYPLLADSDPLIADGKRTCSVCDIEKSLKDFTRMRSSKLGRHTQCKGCVASKQKQYIKKTGYVRYKAYGISSATFRMMFEAQEGKCAICETGVDFQAKTTCVDHDHKTGNIREILCAKCNLGLGHFSDDIENMEKAVAYLKKHSEEGSELKLIEKSKETAE